MKHTAHQTVPLSRAEAVDKLRRHGISPTGQRVDIACLLFATHQHLSAEQLLGDLRAHGIPVSKATVYNTLNLFTEYGLLREVVVDAAKRFYDSNLEPHHHLYHTDTGFLEDVPPVQVDLSGLPGIPNGQAILSVDVIIRVGPQR